jgi:predicted Rossmann fold nucleotide-binding protein DprA/Smf involved in DNA uptake
MIELVRGLDPEEAEKLERLLNKQDVLAKGNVYGEKFTARQFSLVFDPLLKRAVERSQILDDLGRSPATVPELVRALDLKPNIVFDHIKELVRRDRVEITGYDDRDARYRRKETDR